MGNTALSAIGRILHEEIESQKLAIRWGGVEFARILKVSGNDAVRILENLCAKSIQVNFDVELQNTLSAGIASIKQGDTPRAMPARADKALYTFKGRGVIAFRFTKNGGIKKLEKTC